MKSLIIKLLFAFTGLLSSESLMAQSTSLIMEIKGIEEVKGTILVALSSREERQPVAYGKLEVTGKKVVYTMENIPVGKVDISVFQDLNGNLQLDMDKDHIPVEPCYRKQGIKIDEGVNQITIKLVNVKEILANLIIEHMQTFMYIFLFSCITTGLVAQERSGSIVNSKKEPVDFATVVLLKESAQVAATITDDKGHFSFPGEDGEYKMVVQNIAYQPLEQEISLRSGEVELGTFIMEEAAVGLNAIVVTASAITRESDRFVMHVNNTVPSFINKDAAEVLQLAPGVWVDDNGISINGAGGTKVFINNRELKPTSRELATYLRNYQSSDIARVEVIPQAGAEFSADSKGGVVKIILRRKQENGLDGNAMVQTSQGKYYEQYRPSATVNALTGRWIWNGMATGNLISKKRDVITETRDYPVGGNKGFQSQSDRDSKPSLGMGRIGTVFEIDHRNSLGAEMEFWSEKDKTLSVAETMGSSGQEIVHTISDYRQKEKNRNLSVTLDYIHKIDSLGSELKLIADYTDKKVTGDNDYHSRLLVNSGAVDSVYRSNSLSHYTVYTADAILNKKLRSGSSLTTGFRNTVNQVTNRAFYEGKTDAGWDPLNEYNYSLDYTENISALYGTFSTEWGAMGLQAGLRTEYTRVTGKGLEGKKYIDLFPALNLMYAFDPMKTFMLIGQYSRNIQRPNFWHLNSNRVQYSDYSYIVGNPQLRPTYIHRINLTAVYNYRYTLTIGTNMHRDLIREVTKSDPVDPQVKYVIPENHYMENHHFIAISCPLRITRYLSLNTNLTGVKQDIREVKSDKVMGHYLYFVNAIANVTLPAETYFELSYNGTSRLYSANSGIEPSHLLHAQLKKRLCGNRMNLTLGVHNLFNRKASYFAYMDTYTSASEIR